jgi:hypothetical protein
MNWHQAVGDANGLCIQQAIRSVDHRKWPIGGWGNLPDRPESRPVLRERVALLLSVAWIANSWRGQALAHYVASLDDAPAPAAEAGPAEEKWAFAPGTTPEDVAAAEEWCRANDSSSPIHLVAKGYTDKRLEDEAAAVAAKAKLEGEEIPADALDAPPDVSKAIPGEGVEIPIDDSDPFEGLKRP